MSEIVAAEPEALLPDHRLYQKSTSGLDLHSGHAVGVRRQTQPSVTIGVPRDRAQFAIRGEQADLRLIVCDSL